MNKKLKTLLSFIISSLFYFIFNEDASNKSKSFISHHCIELTHDNFKYLMKEEWTVLNGENNGHPPSLTNIKLPNIAVLFINTMNDAELAARFKIVSPNDKIVVKNGEFTKDGIIYKIDRPIALQETLDIYIYYWAIKVRKSLFSKTGYKAIIDNSMYSFTELITDIMSFCIQG